MSSSKAFPFSFLELFKEDDPAYPPLIQRRVFNTSYATTISLFEFQLPRQATGVGTETEIAQQAIFGIFAIVVATTFLTLPAIFTVSRPNDSKRSLQRLLHSTSFHGKEAERLRNRIPLDSRKCIQRAICEAARDGWAGFALWGIDKDKVSEDARIAKEHPFKSAALVGRQSENELMDICKEKFNCFFDLWGLLWYFLRWAGWQENAQ